MKEIMKIRNLVKNKSLFLLLIISLFSHQLFAQTLFYQDVFYGGVTGGGFSTGEGSGSGIVNLYIEPGSTIKKAYLFTYRQGFAPNIPITINGNSFLFDTTNSVMQVAHNHTIVSPIYLYSYDFTDDLNSNITSSFNITIPSQFGLPIGWGYFTLYVYIAYENPTLPKVATSLWINNKDFIGNEFYNFNKLLPINNTYPVGFSLFIDRACNNTSDGTKVILNSNNLGIIGEPDNVNNLWGCSGAKGHFYYQNNTLFGLDDDTPDNLMSGSDALANISSYLNSNDTTFTTQLTHQNYPNMSTGSINSNLAFFLTYTTPCDTFTTTTATTNQDTICIGESVQLNATGGVNYSWYSPFSTFNDSTLANPVATPTQTTTYIVTIKNDSGCVKTEHVKVWVNPAPKPDTIIVTPQRCGSANGSIAVGNIPKGKAPFTYQLTNLQTLNTINQQPSTFNNLIAGNYQLTITDSNGCQWQSDTLVVAEIHDITANFNLYTLPLVFPTPNPLGTAPLTVYTQNSSVNANSYEWIISQQSTVNSLQDTIIQHSTFNISHSFENGGTFEVCLLAYNNIVTCGDTVCKTIVIAPAPDSLVLVVPNVFSPNGDGSNDNFVLQVQSAHLLSNIEVEIFNRWGQEVSSSEFDVQDLASAMASSPSGLGAFAIWDGTTTTGKEVPDGTYFYVISYTKLSGETESLKGSVSLLR